MRSLPKEVFVSEPNDPIKNEGKKNELFLHRNRVITKFRKILGDFLSFLIYISYLQE